MQQDSENIGFFPLRLFMLPSDQTTLHVYEPRYLQLISECIKEVKSFGIPYQTKTSLSEFGSRVKVVQVLKKYENGELDILIECDQNFKLKHFAGKDDNKLYPSGSIIGLSALDHAPSGDLMKTIQSYLELLLDKSVADELHDYFSFKQIIKVLHLDDAEKFRFLKSTEEQKNSFLIHKAKFLAILLEQEKKVVDQFHLN